MPLKDLNPPKNIGLVPPNSLRTKDKTFTVDVIYLPELNRQKSVLAVCPAVVKFPLFFHFL
jgi:hypothetical protein